MLAGTLAERSAGRLAASSVETSAERSASEMTAVVESLRASPVAAER
jgi:hypothetical protein